MGGFLRVSLDGTRWRESPVLVRSSSHEIQENPPMLTLLALLMQPASQPVEPPKKPEAMHPVITEVLYAVPRDGDADQDGKRSATGDEFVELVNPHDKPISLKGYSITDSKNPSFTGEGGKRVGKPDDKKGAGRNDTGSKEADKLKDLDDDARVRFTFPDLTLQPGEVVVVFNGYESSPSGPVGDKDKAAAKNPKFSNAYVLSMKVKSQYVAFANNADCVLLSDPEGKPVQCVSWGEGKQIESAPQSGKAPESRGSVQRTSITGEFVRHQELPGPEEGKKFSPGRFELKKK
jgi:hypothetical protein